MERFAWNEFYGSYSVFRSSLPKVFWKKDVLRNLTKFTKKHLCQSLFFNKVGGLRDSGTGVFAWFSQISRNIFLHRAPLVAASGFSSLRTSYTVRFTGFMWYNSMTQIYYHANLFTEIHWSLLQLKLRWASNLQLQQLQMQ